MHYIKREKYLKQIRQFYDSDLVKVITGIRRSGKSIILQEIMEEIKSKSDNVIYLNFEKTSDLSKAGTFSSLVNCINDNRKDGKCYVFLDEVQEVEDWQIAVKDLRINNCSIFITGSNSKLLSGEITKYLSGRFIAIRVRPFVYKEMLEYSKATGLVIDPNNYLVWGGFPGRFEVNTLEGTLMYLNDIISGNEPCGYEGQFQTNLVLNNIKSVFLFANENKQNHISITSIIQHK